MGVFSNTPPCRLAGSTWPSHSSRTRQSSYRRLTAASGPTQGDSTVHPTVESGGLRIFECLAIWWEDFHTARKKDTISCSWCFRLGFLFSPFHSIFRLLIILRLQFYCWLINIRFSVSIHLFLDRPFVFAHMLNLLKIGFTSSSVNNFARWVFLSASSSKPACVGLQHK